MKLTNREILNLYDGLDAFLSRELPISLKYYLAQNLTALIPIKNLIESLQAEIIKNNPKNYTSQEITELITLEQLTNEINFNTIDINALTNISLNSKEMGVLMFMVNEIKEEEMMVVSFSNEELYSLTESLDAAFSNSELILPLRINYAIQKNLSSLKKQLKDIEIARLAILQEYGTINANTLAYDIPEDKQDIVVEKINNLLNKSSNIDICTIELFELPEDLLLTSEQMSALLFMINA